MLKSFYHTQENIFLGAATGSGKTALAKLSIYKSLHMDESAIVVYVCPMESIAVSIYKKFITFFEPLGFQVGILVG